MSTHCLLKSCDSDTALMLLMFFSLSVFNHVLTREAFQHGVLWPHTYIQSTFETALITWEHLICVESWSSNHVEQSFFRFTHPTTSCVLSSLVFTQLISDGLHTLPSPSFAVSGFTHLLLQSGQAGFLFISSSWIQEFSVGISHLCF